MVGYGVHSFQSICIILKAWCCMICLEDSSQTLVIGWPYCCSTQSGVFFCFMNRIVILLIVLCEIALSNLWLFFTKIRSTFDWHLSNASCSYSAPLEAKYPGFATELYPKCIAANGVVKFNARWPRSLTRDGASNLACLIDSCQLWRAPARLFFDELRSFRVISAEFSLSFKGN